MEHNKLIREGIPFWGTLFEGGPMQDLLELPYVFQENLAVQNFPPSLVSASENLRQSATGAAKAQASGCAKAVAKEAWLSLRSIHWQKVSVSSFLA